MRGGFGAKRALSMNQALTDRRPLLGALPDAGGHAAFLSNTVVCAI